MFIEFSAFGTIVLMVRPYTVELSVITGFGGCWRPISLRVTWSGSADLQPYNNAANSASEDYAMKCLMIEDKSSIVPLLNYLSDSLVE